MSLKVHGCHAPPKLTLNNTCIFGPRFNPMNASSPAHMADCSDLRPPFQFPASSATVDVRVIDTYVPDSVAVLFWAPMTR